MSKSRGNAIALGVDEDETARLLRGAVTDPARRIRHDSENRPGVSSPLLLTALRQDHDPHTVAEEIGDGGAALLKRTAAEAVNVYLRPLRARGAELAADRSALREVLHTGNARPTPSPTGPSAKCAPPWAPSVTPTRGHRPGAPALRPEGCPSPTARPRPRGDGPLPDGGYRQQTEERSSARPHRPGTSASAPSHPVPPPLSPRSRSPKEYRMSLRPLRPGDRVALAATSGAIDPARLALGIDILRSWGLDVTVLPHLHDTHPTLPHLAGTDADRAADLQAAWLDPGIAAVLCARGGFGAHRMVDLLDWDAMRAAEPKPLVGFSDVTVLHEAFAQRLGIPTFYGPMPGTTVFSTDPATAEHLRRTLFDPAGTIVLTGPDATALVPGRAHGVLTGGCASLLAADRGTPGARPSFAGGLLLLEDVNEQPYQLDRILTQLRRSGALDGVAGVVLGSWDGCGPLDGVRAVMLDHLGGLGVPVLWELGFGHCPSSITVPLGVPATLDADAGTLTLDTPVLSGPTGA